MAVTSDLLINGVESEEIGVAFCKKLLGVETNWKKTSYNNNIRFRYAGIGYSYNEELDAFIAPKPYASWILNEETADWVSPVGPAPALTEAESKVGSFYHWNEENGEWDLTTPEGYNPNARDGDGDGIVQEGTHWERPVGT